MPVLPIPTNIPPHSAEFGKGWTTRTATTNLAELQGWRDADAATIAAGNNTSVPPVLPPTPPVVIPPVIVPPVVPPSPITGPLNLTALCASATETVNLDPTKIYIVPSIINLKVGINGNGAKVACSKQGTNFKSSAPNLTVSGLNLVDGGVVFEAASDAFTVHDCTFTGCTQAFKTIPGGTNAHFQNNTVSPTPTVSVYIDQSGAVVSNNVLKGSTQEYPLRLEIGGIDGKTLQSGAIIQDNQITSINGKDAIGIREFNNVKVSGGTVKGDIRIGQVPGAGFPPTSRVGQYCDGIEISGVAFTSNGNAMHALECYQGCRVLVTNNSFTGYAVPCISADVFSEITTSGNTGPSVAKLWASSSRGTHIPK